MKISICIPCMNRTHDLRITMPTLIAAAEASPPVEIAVLDYNSQDDLEEYIKEITWEGIAYTKYTGNSYFHMGHARNMAMLAGSGEYLIMLSTDIMMSQHYIIHLRKELGKGLWTHHSDTYVGVVCVPRQEFIDAGGYDERFEFYGKEDKDFLARLKRRGKPHTQIPDRLSLIYTPWSEKLLNYRGNPSRKKVSRLSMAIYTENCEREVLVANEGKRWGV